jgi:hypothetical protein
MSRTTGSRRPLLPGALAVTALACGSGTSGSVSPGGADASTQPDGDAGGVDAGGEAQPPSPDAGPSDSFVGDCQPGAGSGAISGDASSPPRGLTVLATGIQGSAGLEVDARYAYFASTSTISRVPLDGGPPEVMVANARPVAIGIAGADLVWSDATGATQTQILTVPLTAVGWIAFAGTDGGATRSDAGLPDAGADAASPVATMLATVPGVPGAFALAGTYAYFTAGDVITRVPTGGGPIETVASGLAPTGIAVGSNLVYLGDGNEDVIDQAYLGFPDGGPIGIFTPSHGTPTQVALGSADLYWGDQFGTVDHVALSTPYLFDGFHTPCAIGACFPRHVRSGGPGAVWESDDNVCGHVGTVGPSGTTLFATDIAAVQSLAVDATHLYANTVLGELLRFDL